MRSCTLSKTPVPVPKPANVLAFPKTKAPSLPEVLYEPGKTIVEFDQPVDTAFIVVEGSVNVFIRVMERGAKGRDIEVVRQEPIYEIGPGGIINAELFSKSGAYGFDSPVKIVARRAVRLMMVTDEDLSDPTIPENQKLSRLRQLTEMLADALVKSELKRQLHRLDEDSIDLRIDEEREKRNDLTRRLVASQSRIHELELLLEAAKRFDPKQFWATVTDDDLEDGLAELFAEDTAVTDPTKQNPPSGG